MNPPPRNAIITGASSGIGAAIVQTLAVAGTERILLVARRFEELEAVAASCTGKSEVLAVDLSNKGAETEIAAAWGDSSLDLLVNAAGIGRLSSLIEGDPAEWSEMLEVNLLAVARVTKALLPRLSAERGQIVNISSMSGRRIPPSGGFYAVTKFALRALSESLRNELRGKGSQVRVTMISPGFVDTDLAREYLGKAGRSVEDLGFPVLEPEDVASAVLSAVTTSDHAEVNDILIRPRAQST